MIYLFDPKVKKTEEIKQKNKKRVGFPTRRFWSADPTEHDCTLWGSSV